GTYGSDGQKIGVPYRAGGTSGHYTGAWQGVHANVMRGYEASSSDTVREQLSESMVPRPCHACGGTRLRPESLAVTVAGRSIGEVVEMSVSDALAFFEGLRLTGTAPADRKSVV